MENEHITNNSEETRELGKALAKELKGGEMICLSGELGAGKTTFTQGLLEGLGVEGPYTSPTFVVMKQYQKKITNYKLQITNKHQNPKSKIQNVYHIDAYRVDSGDILALGFEEIISDSGNIVIIEWAERIKDIIPPSAVWIKFEWIGEEERKIKIQNAHKH